MERVILYKGREIRFEVVRKKVKNINLRVRPDLTVTVSANNNITEDAIDNFVYKKGDWIIKCLDKFENREKLTEQEYEYVSGESIRMLGKDLRLKVMKADIEGIEADNNYVYLKVRDTDDITKKKKLVDKWLDKRCEDVFAEITAEIYPTFAKYGVTMPQIRIRNMKTRWGSCATKRGVISLNKMLIKAPRYCIEYVITHEFAHFLHPPNHSKKFYTFMSVVMPDYKERKRLLEG